MQNLGSTFSPYQIGRSNSNIAKNAEISNQKILSPYKIKILKNWTILPKIKRLKFNYIALISVKNVEEKISSVQKYKFESFVIMIAICLVLLVFNYNFFVWRYLAFLVFWTNPKFEHMIAMITVFYSKFQKRNVYLPNQNNHLKKLAEL